MKVVSIPIVSLRPAPYNPKGRLADGPISALANSVAAYGILQPIQVSTNGDGVYDIIDGHRRVKAARMAGHKDVPAIVTKHRFSQQTMYQELSGPAMRKISNAEYMEVYVLGGRDAVPQNTLREIRALEYIVGEKGLKKLVECGASSRLIDDVRRVSNYVGKDDDLAWQKKFAFYAARYRQAWRARQAVRAGVDPKLILKCVEANESIPQIWETRLKATA